jgi:Glyoxalase-like domain
VSRPRGARRPVRRTPEMCISTVRSPAAALLASACSALSATPPPLVPPPPLSAPQLIGGLDHVPVAVADLDRAAADFASLGFVIKPGRPHTNSIQNRHIKFPNGSEIELITATASNDAQSAEYVAWLKTGDGPAFWSIYSPDLKALTTSLDALRLTPHREGDLVTWSGTESHRLFFGNRLKSPTDGPPYWAHPNTAYKLRAVWLSTSGDVRPLLGKLNGDIAEEVGCAPFDSQAKGVVLPVEGDEVFVTSRVPRSPSRSIIGVTLLVRDIGAARRVLERADIPFVPATGPCAGTPQLWIPPSHAHNLWLELRQ